MPRAAETVVLTCLALLAFAANSLLTRVALAHGRIDAATFTLVRLAAGALALALLVRAKTGRWRQDGPLDLISPFMLFAYAGPFSFAYLRIGAALGALVLFGTVQITMIGYSVARGERPERATWLGLALAIGGLGALTLPAADRPDAHGMALMIVAGIAWAIYSLRGRAAGDPLAANAHNFLWSLPFALLLSFIMGKRAIHLGARGIGLAVVSGAVTSGIGYAIWYRALPGLGATRAAIVQLSVPVLAAAGAVALMGERATPTLLVCGAAVIGGVALALRRKARQSA